MRAWRTVQRSISTAGDISLLHSCTRRSLSTTRLRRSIAARLDGVSYEPAGARDIVVEGWVRSVRKQKKVAFAAVSDGSTTRSLQVVLKPEDAVELTTGTAVRLKGDLVPSAGSKQSHELQVSRVEVLGENDASNNPLQSKYQTPEYLRTIPHLRARIPSNALLLRLRSHLIAALTNFFNRNDFVQTHTPIITSSDCEGAGEVFTASSNTPSSKSLSQSAAEHDDGDAANEHFFRAPKYLTVSAQLHLEALAQAVTKVWTLSPTFRAERSDTPRHLAEFYMLEAEMCFVNDLDSIMDHVENMLRSAVVELSRLRIYSELLEMQREQSQSKSPSSSDSAHHLTPEHLSRRWNGLIAPTWPRITYKDAIEILQEAHATNSNLFSFPPSHASGLQAEHERYLAAHLGGAEGTPVFITRYPRSQKPFYMSPSPTSNPSTAAQSDESDSDTVSCFDLLVPNQCELAGGSLREHRSSHLLAAMRAKNLEGAELDWYQDLRRFGSVPHGGFGLGFDRLVAYLGGVGSVRDVVAFPRWVGRCGC